MKLKKISQLCNKQKAYIIYDKPTRNGDATQWLGDGCAAYPLDGLPLLDTDSLCRMFDISKEQRDKMLIQQTAKPDGVCMDDAGPEECKAERMEPGIVRGGREFIPLMTRAGIVFIQKKYLAPLDDEGVMLEFYERRTPGGQIYIAIKTGMLCRGLVFPVEIVDDKFVHQLEDMQRECGRLVERGRPQAEDGGAFQLTWTEEPGEEAP